MSGLAAAHAFVARGLPTPRPRRHVRTGVNRVVSAAQSRSMPSGGPGGPQNFDPEEAMRRLPEAQKLVEEITRVSVEVLGGSPESVDILITDVKRENWATGGKLWLERS